MRCQRVFKGLRASTLSLDNCPLGHFNIVDLRNTPYTRGLLPVGILSVRDRGTSSLDLSGWVYKFETIQPRTSSDS